MCKKIISNGEPLKVFDGDRISSFERPNGIPAPQHVVAYNYMMWLMESVGLNGPNPKQYSRMPETEDQTYFVLGMKLFNTRFNASVPFDDNRVADGRRLRDVYTLVSAYSSYLILDTPGANMLEVLVALVQRFDTDVMMTEDGKERHKEWFWLMMKNCGLDIFVDSQFTKLDSDADMACSSIINLINERGYDKSGLGGFFPMKKSNDDQREKELWKQMHEYFLENLID